MTSEQPGDAAAPRPRWLALVGILAALVAIAVVGWWQFSGEAQHDAHEQHAPGADDARKDDPGRSVDEFTKAIELRPDDPKAYFNRGVNYAETGDLGRAIADFTKAIALKPDDAEAYNARGNAHRKKGDLDRAIADLTKAVELDPRFAEAYLNRGLAYRKKGDHDRATGNLIGAVVLDPSGPVGSQPTDHLRRMSERRPGPTERVPVLRRFRSGMTPLFVRLAVPPALLHRLKASSTPLPSPADRRCARAPGTSPAASR